MVINPWYSQNGDAIDLELCFELKRWPDLMRAHHAGTIDIYSYIPNLVGKSTPLYFPILRKIGRAHV